MQSERRLGSCGIVAQLPDHNPLQKICPGARHRVVVLQKIHCRDGGGGHLIKTRPARVPAPERRACEAPLVRRRCASPSVPARPLDGGAPGPRRLLDDGGLGRRRPTTDRWAGFGCTVKVRIHADTGDRNRTGTCCTLCSGTEADTYKRTRLVKNKQKTSVSGACKVSATPMLPADSTLERGGVQNPTSPRSIEERVF